MLVQEVMTHEVVTVGEVAPVKAAVELLARHRVTSLPVLSRSGELGGVVSEADLIGDLVSADARCHEIPVTDHWHDRPTVVAEVMTPHAVTVKPTTDLDDAVEAHHVDQRDEPPVVDHGRIVGMFSRSDVVQVLGRTDADLARDVDAMLTWVGLADWLADVTGGTVTLTGPERSQDAAIARLLAGSVPGYFGTYDPVSRIVRNARWWATH